MQHQVTIEGYFADRKCIRIVSWTTVASHIFINDLSWNVVGFVIEP